MLGYLAAIIVFGSVFGVAILLASKEGSKAAQLENLKAELKKLAEEQRRANETIDRVRNMSDDDVRNRLHQIGQDK